MSQESAKLIYTQEAFAGFLSDIRHGEFLCGTLLDHILISGVLEASPKVCSDFTDSGFAIAVFRHSVQKQLQRSQRDLTR